MISVVLLFGYEFYNLFSSIKALFGIREGDGGRPFNFSFLKTLQIKGILRGRIPCKSPSTV